MTGGSPAGAAGRAAPVLPARRSAAAALLVSLRPAQWLKNAALLAAPVFAHRITDPQSLWPLAAALAAFCLLASGVYLGNDLVDRERDRLHPRKRRRPIAAGELAPAPAAAAAVALVAGALGLAALVGARFLAVALGYLALQALYTGVLKRVVVLDVFAIAAGFVLRVVAGAEAIDVPISNWLYLCTLLLALFLALSKRRAEIAALGADGLRDRPPLADYSLPMLDQLVTVACACTVLAYALYTLAPDTIAKFGTDRLKFTVPFVLFGLFRYLYLLHRGGEGEQPERVLLTDRPTQTNLTAYAMTVAWAIYG